MTNPADISSVMFANLSGVITLKIDPTIDIAMAIAIKT
jgi:hypothetical protein